MFHPLSFAFILFSCFFFHPSLSSSSCSTPFPLLNFYPQHACAHLFFFLFLFNALPVSSILLPSSSSPLPPKQMKQKPSSGSAHTRVLVSFSEAEETHEEDPDPTCVCVRVIACVICRQHECVLTHFVCRAAAAVVQQSKKCIFRATTHQCARFVCVFMCDQHCLCTQLCDRQTG